MAKFPWLMDDKIAAVTLVKPRAEAAREAEKFSRLVDSLLVGFMHRETSAHSGCTCFNYFNYYYLFFLHLLTF